MAGDFLFVSVGRGVLLPSSGLRPGMLLNILQYTEQFPTTRNYPARNTNRAVVENPELEELYKTSIYSSNSLFNPTQPGTLLFHGDIGLIAKKK